MQYLHHEIKREREREREREQTFFISISNKKLCKENVIESVLLKKSSLILSMQ
jgi:hypothetical protein